MTAQFIGCTMILYVQAACAGVMCMSNITIRIPEDWSEIARKAFEDAARKEEIQCAAESIKKLRNESEQEWNGAKEIRKWRDAK